MHNETLQLLSIWWWGAGGGGGGREDLKDEAGVSLTMTVLFHFSDDFQRLF